MASQGAKGPQPARQGATRMPTYPQPAGRDDNDSLKPPKRAHTFHNGSPAERHRDKATGRDGGDAPDAFETSRTLMDVDDNIEITRASVDLNDLPIELITLTDRCVARPPRPWPCT